MINIVTTANIGHASYRYRSEVIHKTFLRAGIKCSITPTFHIDATVCVYSKHFNLTDYVDAIGAKAMGKRIVFDVCDDHFDPNRSGERTEHYLRMIDLADELTCNSPAQARIIMQHTKRSATVIPDPIIMQPVDRDPDLEKWCWIGHHSNLPALVEWLPLIDRPITVCTTWEKGLDHPLVTNVPWTPENGEKVLDEHGVCLVPYADSRAGQAKSANRILEALNKSMVVVTNGVEASTDLLAGTERVPAYVGPHSIEKMKLGRDYARKHYSMEVIGKLWRRALT